MHTHCYDNIVVRFKHFFHSVVGEVEVLFSYVWFLNIMVDHCINIPYIKNYMINLNMTAKGYI